MEICFEKIGERDIDLLMMYSFSSDRDFRKLFFEEIGWKESQIVSIEHSLTDPELGESDVTVVIRHGNSKHGILIENKIDADAQPNQCQRYYERGKRGINEGKYGSFSTLITAPQAYLDTNPEASKYDYRVSYERMLQFFESKCAAFECTLLQAAIKKKETGYTVLEVPAITAFWKELYQYVCNNRYAIEMNCPDGAKGSRSMWVQFRTPLRGTSLYFKSKQGYIDLEFTGKYQQSERIRETLYPVLEDGMRWEVTGKSISLRLITKPINFSAPFLECKDDVDLMLSNVERMTAFATKLYNSGFTVQ